ncbi:MAG: hypothetical protein ACYC1M_02810 [Armatimonadota bacterium]
MKKKKKSFWDMPEWYVKWRYSAPAYLISLIFYIAYIVQSVSVGHHAETYAIVSPVIIFALAYLIGRIIYQDRSCAPSCLFILMATPLVGFLGYVIFGHQMLRFDKPTVYNPWGISPEQTLFAISIIATIWLVIMLATRDRNARKK